MKKKVFKLLMIAMLCATGSIFAQIPQGINYQAVVRDGSGAIAAGTTVTFRFSFHEGAAIGTVRYSETFTTNTDAYGMANVVLGTGSPVSGSFAAVDWALSNFLQLEVNLTGTFVNLGTDKIQSVPYALNAGGGFWDASGNDIHNSNSGNVAIGTTNYLAPLTIGSGAAPYPEGIVVEPSTDATSERASVKIGDYSLIQDYAGSGAKNFSIYNNVNGSWPIFVGTDDNIGMGTTSPTDKLHLAGADLLFKMENTSNGAILYLLPPTANATGGLGIDGNFDLPLFTNGLDRLTVKADGKVGIGTTTPDAKLTIGNPGTTWTDYGITSDSRIGVTDGAGNQRTMIMGPAIYGGYIAAFDYASNTQQAVVINAETQFKAWGDGYLTMCTAADNTSGNAGVGPSVYNNVKLTVSSTLAYALAVEGVAGKTGGGTWAGLSDARLKKDINPYSDGLSTLLKIKPVTYHYNELSGFNMETEYVGVIAQELNEVAPYMVSSSEFKNTGNEYLQVDNSAMTYMLINAVKEQQAQIETLKAEIAAMKK